MIASSALLIGNPLKTNDDIISAVRKPAMHIHKFEPNALVIGIELLVSRHPGIAPRLPDIFIGIAASFPQLLQCTCIRLRRRPDIPTPGTSLIRAYLGPFIDLYRPESIFPTRRDQWDNERNIVEPHRQTHATGYAPYS